MKILFPYLARWRSANRSRYHQLLAHLCELGHKVYVLNAPPMAINDISAKDIIDENHVLPQGLTINELYAPEILRSFYNTPIRRSKLLKKGLISLTSIRQIRRHVDREKIDVLLLYNLPQAPLLQMVECRTHFDLADDLVAMMGVEDGLSSKAGGIFAARAVQNHMLARSKTVTVASTELRDKIDRPTMMLPNGANIANLDLADGRAWRARVKGPTVGFVGAFEYWVDFDLILDVARKLHNVMFILVGGGRRMNYVRERIAAMGLMNIYLTGAISYDDAMDYAAGMDVCLLPFNQTAVSHGSCPLKLFEYAALRKPIVSTSTREVMRIGRDWINFADGAENFSDAIESFLTNRSLAERAGDTGRSMVENFYNWPKLARLFERLLISGSFPGLELAVPRRAAIDPARNILEARKSEQ